MSATVAVVAAERTRLSVSLSTVMSPVRLTVTVLVVSPAAKLTVVRARAVSSLLVTLAVPSLVWYLTVEGPWVLPDR